MEYVRRILDTELDELFDQVSAIAIDGPKGVGKTTTAEQRVASVVRLDSKAVRESIAAELRPVVGETVGLQVAFVDHIASAASGKHRYVVSRANAESSCSPSAEHRHG